MATPPVAPVSLAWSNTVPVTLDWTDEAGAETPTGDPRLDFSDPDNSQYLPGL